MSGEARSGGAATRRTAEVVVIGAGVIGASIAYHLARRGCRDVVVLDRAPSSGLGSTGRATGGFRAQFATAVNVRLSLLAREALRRFPDELGVDPGYRPSGYLFVATRAEQLAPLRDAQRVQQAFGLHEAEEVGAEDVVRLNPALAGDDVVGGVFCGSDGFVRPLDLLGGYLRGAERLGATVCFGSGVRALHRGPDGRVRTVETERGERIATGAVVNAAGAWASAVAALAGVPLPVRAVRRQVACLAAPCPLPDDMPMTIFVEDGFHLRVRDGRVLLLAPPHRTPQRTPRHAASHGGATVADAASDAAALPRGAAPPDEDPSLHFDERWLEDVTARARRRLPCLGANAVERARCWAGWYEMSPDGHAILGAAPAVPNLYLANGSSGHGVMHSPALGLLVAELVLDGRASSLDVAPLAPERFAAGRGITTPDLF